MSSAMEEDILATPFPLLSITSKDSLHLAKTFHDESLPTIFIGSYPKSGTTWMQCIVYQILTRGQRPRFRHISDFTPFFDSQGTFDLERRDLKDNYQQTHAQLGFHVFNTHFAWEMLPHKSNMKYIYVIRDGKDAIVSFFHHLSNQDDADVYEGTFQEFLKMAALGKMPYGSRPHHIINWWRARRDEDNAANILFVKYEDLIHNLASEVRKIINFLGLLYEEEEIEHILPLMSFQYMKAHREQFEPISVPWKDGYQFIRKGQIGDHRTMFSMDDELMYKQVLDEIIQETTGDLSVEEKEALVALL